MATRGVFQLQRLNIYYCEYGGSSRTVREYIQHGHLHQWASSKSCQVHVHVRNGRHPLATGEYRTQTSQHFVTLKNAPLFDIQAVLNMMHNRSGRRITSLSRTVYTDTPSIQGVWTPFLNLQHEAEFDVQVVQGGGGEGSTATAEGE